MRSSQPRFRRGMALVALLGLVALLAGSIPAVSPFGLFHLAQAQIDNNQSSQPFASVVACIRSGADLGRPSNQSPRFATTCFGSAWNQTSYIPSGDTSNGDAPAGDAAIVEFGDAKPDDGVTDGTGAASHTTQSTLGEVGSVYGLAYATGTNPSAPTFAHDQRLFAGAFTKRLTRFGVGGPGAIYLFNRTLGTTNLYVQVPNVVPGPTGLPGNPGDGSSAAFPNGLAYTPQMGGVHTIQHDYGALPFVGRTGLGDIELDPTEQYLYALNLHDRRIYRYDTWSANPQATQFLLPDVLSLFTPCVTRGGVQNWHPFTLKVTAQAIYLGGVCSAETTGNRADLAVRVERYDRTTFTWSNALIFDLASFDTQRGVWFGNNLAWQPWNDNVATIFPNAQTYSQPILSDLELAEDGSLILGLRSRSGDQGASWKIPAELGRAFGDLLRATPNGSGGWNVPPTGAEQYQDDDSATHDEQTWGGTAYVPGTHAGGYGGEVATTYLTPYRFNSGGAAWFDALATAGPQAREELYYTGKNDGTDPTTFAKTEGLGDLELLCAWRAIGDRIWRDTNSNGIQDAGESNINGVHVQLLDSGGNVIAAVTSGSVTGMSGNYRFYVDPFQSYTVRIDPTDFNAGGPLFGLSLTPQKMGGDDTLDSDADASGQIAVAPAGNGDVNVTFDAGLTTGANVRISKSGPATIQRGATIGYTLTYANDGPSAAQNVVVIDDLPAGVTLVNASPTPASVSGQTLAWTLGTLPAGASGSITVNATVTTAASSSIVNQAQITTSTFGDNPGDNTSTVTTGVLDPNVQIVKSGPATVTVGDALAYTLAYANTGTGIAASVTVVDTLPAGLTFVSASPAPSSISGQTVTWNLGTLAAGASGNITVNVQSSSALANGTVLTNQAQISTPSPGDNPGDNTSTTTTTAQRADVRITKSSPNSFPVSSGTSVTYYLDFSNAGPAAAVNVTLSDLVPSQITGVSWGCTAGCSGSGTGNTISLNLGTLVAGATGRVTVTGTAQTTITREDFTNTATISTATPETDTTNNQSSVPGAVWTDDIQIIKLAQAQVAAGDTFTATLTYKNNGPAPAASVQLVDTLPAGVTFVSASPGPSSFSGQTLTWNLGTLADAQTGSVSLVLRSDAALANNTTVTNQSQISTTTSDRDSSNNSNSAQTVVVSRADVTVTKIGPARADAGGAIAYTLTYANAGPSVARTVVLTDTLPPELDFVSASPAPATTANGVLTWNLGDLNPGQNGTITVQMSSQFFQRQATITATNRALITTATTDPMPTNNTSNTDTNIETVDVSIVKVMPAFVVAGTTFTATLAYANAGPATANSVTLRDLLPSGLTFVSSVPPPTGPGLRWNLGNLPPGASGQIVLTLRTAASTPNGTTYTNQAVIDTASSDRDSANDTSSAATTVRPNADVSIVKIGPSSPIRSGSIVTYTLAYANAGPSVATATVVTDTLPAGFTFSQANPAPASNANGVLAWNLGDLMVGGNGSITVVGTLMGNGTSTARDNTAQIGSVTPDPTPTNNTSTVQTTVLKPDLNISKTDGVTQVQPGDVLTYTLTVRNGGPITATGVLLTETPPPGATVLSNAWAPSGSSYTLTVGAVGPTTTLTRTFVLRMPNPLSAGGTGSVVNTATATDDGSAGPDPTPGDNTTTDTDTPIVGHVGDFIWYDKNGDRNQDPGEPGLANVPLQLIDPVTGAVLATMTTDSTGHYGFDGLRLGDYAIRIDPAALASDPLKSYQITTNPIPVTALDPNKPRDDTLDIGLKPPATTAVAMAYLLVQPQGSAVAVRWGTLAEQNTAYFRVLRSATNDMHAAVQIGSAASVGSQGGDYIMLDRNPLKGPAYYWLVEVEHGGLATTYGPATSRLQSVTNPLYVPLVRR